MGTEEKCGTRSPEDAAKWHLGRVFSQIQRMMNEHEAKHHTKHDTVDGHKFNVLDHIECWHRTGMNTCDAAGIPIRRKA